MGNKPMYRQIADAFRYQETNQHFGKIVLDI